MSGGRNKLGDFAQLKSLVSSKFKGLKEKKDRLRGKASEIHSNHNVMKNTNDQEQSTFHKSVVNKKKPVKRMDKASTHKNFHMPQYGQKVSLDDITTENDHEDEIVIAVDTRQQVKMDQRRLFGWLCKRFPKCFNPKNKKPLKIGISEEIEVTYKSENQADIDQMALRQTLRRYVGDQNYQKSILKYKARYDLMGNVVEEMTAAHLSHAEARLAELIEKAEFRKNGGTNKEYYEMKAKLAAEVQNSNSDDVDIASVEGEEKAIEEDNVTKSKLDSSDQLS